MGFLYIYLINFFILECILLSSLSSDLPKLSLKEFDSAFGASAVFVSASTPDFFAPQLPRHLQLPPSHPEVAPPPHPQALAFISDGAVTLNGRAIMSESDPISTDEFVQGIAVLKRGRRNVRVLISE